MKSDYQIKLKKTGQDFALADIKIKNFCIQDPEQMAELTSVLEVFRIASIVANNSPKKSQGNQEA